MFSFLKDKKNAPENAVSSAPQTPVQQPVPNPGVPESFQPIREEIKNVPRKPAQDPVIPPDELKKEDWMSYWMNEIGKPDISSPNDPPDIYEQITVGLPAPLPKTISVPHETISGFQVPLEPGEAYHPPHRLTPPVPPALSGVQVPVSPKPSPVGHFVRKKPPVPEGFIRVDPYTQPPDADVIDAPDCLPEWEETGVICLDPKDTENK